SVFCASIHLRCEVKFQSRLKSNPMHQRVCRNGGPPARILYTDVCKIILTSDGRPGKPASIAGVFSKVFPAITILPPGFCGHLQSRGPNHSLEEVNTMSRRSCVLVITGV